MTTEQQLQAHLKTRIKTINYSSGFGEFKYKEQAKVIKCTDGFSMSVQASKNHYCEPRADKPKAYRQVEVGFPSARDELLMPYVEDETNPTGTVYAFVPIEVVCQVIENHGGFKENDHAE